MKSSPRLLPLLLLPALVSLPVGSAWSQQREVLPELKSARVVERGSHHAKWETVQEVADPISGETISVTNSYVQLETGLHYQDERGEWQESSEEIEVQPGAAVARRGPHQVRWAANLNTYGAIEFWTPEGEAINSHVLGLAYFDPATGANVMIGEVQDSVGAVAGNQVIYEDAFDGVSADLHYTYTKGGFVQDVIVREQLPDPALWGFDPATVQVQVLTEFVTLPDELKELARITSEASVATNALTGSFEAAYAEDQALNFGSMSMTQGRAFGVMDEAQERAVPVRKTLQLFESGRNILVETLDYVVMEPELETLPENSKPTASLDRKSSERQIASLRVAPPAPTRQWAAVEAATDEDKEPLLMARAELPAGRNGYVIDYNLSGTTNNLTLQGDTTYHVTGLVTATGTTTIEGGTVVKFANTNNAQLKLQGALKSHTALYRPAIFTAKDDNLIGTTISGSTGSPAGWYATNAVFIDNFAADLKHLHIRYAWRGVYLNWNNSAAQNLSHVQMVKCANGVVAISPNFNVRNALFNEVLTNFHTTSTAITGRIEHLTSDKANRLNGSANLTLFVTNSILSAMTNSSTYTGAGTATYTTGTGVFQSLGAGNYYLANGSTNRNAGLTNINALIKSNFARMTTYPPQVFSNHTFTGNTTLAPVVQRDTDLPDRGYHYAALDYTLSTLAITNATLVLTNGVAFGVFGFNGIWTSDHGHLFAEGSPLQPVVFTAYEYVQEQPVVWGTSSARTMINPYRYAGSSAAGTISLRFVEMNARPIDNLTYFQAANWRAASLLVKDSEIHNGGFSLYDATPVTFQNNLLHRTGYVSMTEPNLTFYNNTLVGGGMFLDDDFGPSTFTFRDNLFHRAGLTYISTNGTFTASHNGFTAGSTITPLQHASNKTNLTADFQSGTLGHFYYPASGTGLFQLVNAGSRSAPNAGLFHFTTQTSQTKEGSSTVDMGYHYVALNGSGQPVDTDGDGFADYFEDRNGNGALTPDAGETDWDNVVNQHGPDMTLILFTPLSK